MKASPKAAKRKRDATRAMAKSIPIVAARSGGRCEAQTDECEGAATQFHHRAGRGFEGCHDERFLLHVCGRSTYSGCHGAAHQRPDWAKRHGLFHNHDTEIIDFVPGCSFDCPEDHR